MAWNVSKDSDEFRRAMYTYWKRSAPYPSLSIFDAPNADVVCVRRVMSDTPLQALTTLNDTVFYDAAQRLALRVCKEGGKSDRERAVYAFRLWPQPGGTPICLNCGICWRSCRKRKIILTTAPDDGGIKVASRRRRRILPPDVNLHKVAAWTLAARSAALLNMDETITKE